MAQFLIEEALLERLTLETHLERRRARAAAEAAAAVDGSKQRLRRVLDQQKAAG